MWEAGSPEPGKITRALWLTESFAEEIEADLQRYYGLDYLEHFRPGGNLGWRKLLVLIDRLPPESALNTAIRNMMPDDRLAELAGDPVKAPWSTIESLLAGLIDEIRILGWMYVSAHTDKSIPRPQPVKRPGVTGRARKKIPIEAAMRMDPRLRGLSPEEAQAALDRMTGRG
jgi:hypothetical protein